MRRIKSLIATLLILPFTGTNYLQSSNDSRDSLEARLNYYNLWQREISKNPLKYDIVIREDYENAKLINLSNPQDVQFLLEPLLDETLAFRNLIYYITKLNGHFPDAITGEDSIDELMVASRRYIKSRRDYFENLGLPFDCRLINTYASINFLNINPSSRVELVAGNAINQDINPNGEGHCWIKIDEKIYDAAISKESQNSTTYIPWVSISLSKEKGQITCSPKAYQFFRDDFFIQLD
jgi:hypothetical protein